jgi:hypothetical protein
MKEYNPNREEWKEYNVTYIGGILGTSTVIIKAQNKTWARKFFNGEHNPQCKITKIEEVKKGNQLYRWKVVLSDGDPKHMDISVEIPEAADKTDVRKQIKNNLHYKFGRNIIKSITKVCEVID